MSEREIFPPRVNEAGIYSLSGGKKSSCLSMLINIPGVVIIATVKAKTRTVHLQPDANERAAFGDRKTVW